MEKAIKNYVKELESFLAVLPKKDRDAQMVEIKDHLLQAVQEGENEHEVLMNFLSPEELAKDILAEYQRLYNFSEDEIELTKKKPRSLKKLWIALSIIMLIWMFFFFGPFIKYKDPTPIPVEDGTIEYESNE